MPYQLVYPSSKLPQLLLNYSNGTTQHFLTEACTPDGLLLKRLIHVPHITSHCLSRLGLPTAELSWLLYTHTIFSFSPALQPPIPSQLVMCCTCCRTDTSTARRLYAQAYSQWKVSHHTPGLLLHSHMHCHLLLGLLHIQNTVRTFHCRIEVAQLLVHTP